MDNFLELDPFEHIKTQVERIKFMARALAYGVISDQWSPKFFVSFREEYSDSDEYGGLLDRKLAGEWWQSIGKPTYEKNLSGYLETKWKYQQPLAAFLESFGYVEHKATHGQQREYLLTPKAYALLEQPLRSRVFISYKRAESSAFALLIHDRLEAASFDAFIDMQSIEPGENWLNSLNTAINKADTFICLIGKNTLKSPAVQKEIQWALEREAPFRAIPVWHNKYRYKAGTYPEFAKFLSEKNAIIVDNEHVLAYDNAIRQLIQFLELPRG